MSGSIKFRNRAHEVSRLEAFSDVIFGFAISLLVVSLEAPKSFHQLMEMMSGIIPFAICFFVFIDIWFEHHDFFRRYNLHDFKVVALNTMLLFVILFYVYPLKYVFTMFVNSLRGEVTGITQGDMPILFTIYGLGLAAVFTVIGMMYRHAYTLRDELELNEVEVIDTRESILDNFSMAAFGIVSAIVANVVPLRWCAVAGFMYFLIGVPKTLIPMFMRRKREQAEQRLLAV
ncbi:MAG TPA: TMEM175 family protein [Thermoanaerobaculia bacterium]|nr:TMEM175 family protein [Thermoanaerobaculia bacterium]